MEWVRIWIGGLLDEMVAFFDVWLWFCFGACCRLMVLGGGEIPAYLDVEAWAIGLFIASAFVNTVVFSGLIDGRIATADAKAAKESAGQWVLKRPLELSAREIRMTAITRNVRVRQSLRPGGRPLSLAMNMFIRGSSRRKANASRVIARPEIVTVGIVGNP